MKESHLHNSFNSLLASPSALTAGSGSSSPARLHFPASISMDVLHQQDSRPHFPNPFPTVPLETFDFEAFKAATEENHQESRSPAVSSPHLQNLDHQNSISTVFPPLNFNAATGTFYEPIFGSHIPASFFSSDHALTEGTNSLELPETAKRKFPLFPTSTFKPLVKGLTGNHAQPISQSSQEMFDRSPLRPLNSQPASKAKLVAYEYMYKPISMLRGAGTKRPPLRDRIPEPNTKVSYEKVNLPVLRDSHAPPYASQTVSPNVYPTKPSYKHDHNTVLDSLIKIPPPVSTDKTSAPSFGKESSIQPIMAYAPNAGSQVKSDKGKMQDEGPLREYLPFPPNSISTPHKGHQKFTYVHMKPNVNYARPPDRLHNHNDFAGKEFQNQMTGLPVSPITAKPVNTFHKPQQQVVQYHHQLNHKESGKAQKFQNQIAKSLDVFEKNKSLHSADLPMIQYEVDPWLNNPNPQENHISIHEPSSVSQSKGPQTKTPSEGDVRPVFIPTPGPVKVFTTPSYKKHRPLFPETPAHFSNSDDNNSHKNYGSDKHHNHHTHNHINNNGLAQHPSHHQKQYNNNFNLEVHAPPIQHPSHRQVMSTRVPQGINHHHPHHFQLQNLVNYHGVQHQLSNNNNNNHHTNGHLSHVSVEQEVMMPVADKDNNQGSNELDQPMPTTPPVFGQKIPTSGKKLTPPQVIKSMDDLYVNPPYTKSYTITTTQTPKFGTVTTQKPLHWYDNHIFDRLPQQEVDPGQPRDFRFSPGPQLTATAPTALQEESQIDHKNQQNRGSIYNVPVHPQHTNPDTTQNENVRHHPQTNKQNQESYDTRYNFREYNNLQNKVPEQGNTNGNDFWSNIQNNNQNSYQPEPIDEGRPEPEDVDQGISSTAEGESSQTNQEQQHSHSGNKTRLTQASTIKLYNYNRLRTTTTSTTTTTKRPTTKPYVVDLEEEDWEEDYSNSHVKGTTETPVAQDAPKEEEIILVEEPKRSSSLNLFKKRPDYTKLYSKYRKQSTTTTTTTQVAIPTTSSPVHQSKYIETKISLDNKDNQNDHSNPDEGDNEDKKNWGSRISIGKTGSNTPRTSVSVKTSVSSSVTTYPYNPTKKSENQSKNQFAGIKKSVTTTLDSSQSMSDTVYQESPKTTSTTMHPPSLKYNSPAMNRFKARTSTTTTTTPSSSTPTFFVGKLGNLEELGLFDVEDIGDDASEAKENIEGKVDQRISEESNQPEAQAFRRIFSRKTGASSTTSVLARKLSKRVNTV
jgi:hypothetical protein